MEDRVSMFIGTILAAECAGVSTRTIHRWIRDDKIAAVRIAGTREWAIDASTLPERTARADGRG